MCFAYRDLGSKHACAYARSSADDVSSLFRCDSRYPYARTSPRDFPGSPEPRQLQTIKRAFAISAAPNLHR